MIINQFFLLSIRFFSVFSSYRMSDDEFDPFDLGEIDGDPSMQIVEDDDGKLQFLGFMHLIKAYLHQ